jgi:L-ascorbate metabolism protein UlaG (beta-lactamase superfamily)
MSLRLDKSPLTGWDSLLPPAGGVALAWLGQAGFLVEAGGRRVVIDAYLSDSLAEKYRGKRFPHIRMMPPPIPPGALMGVDWLLCTHAHTDHMDPGTIPALVAANPRMRVVAPRAAYETALARGVPEDRLILVDVGETLDLGGLVLTATPAAHETLALTEKGEHPFLGYVLATGQVTLWHSGDTVPFDGLESALAPHSIDLTLLPINGRDAERAANGVPGNLTVEEAVALTDQIGAGAMIGHHFGLFDFNTVPPGDAADRIAECRPAARVLLAEAGCIWRASRDPEE